MQRAHIGKIASFGGAATLVGGLLALSPQLRRHAQSIADGQPSPELVGINAKAQDLIHGAAEVLKDYSLDNAVLVLFAVLAVVLVVIMFRS
jgi:hypothetical protein